MNRSLSASHGKFSSGVRASSEGLSHKLKVNRVQGIWKSGKTSILVFDIPASRSNHMIGNFRSSKLKVGGKFITHVILSVHYYSLFCGPFQNFSIV